MNRDNKFFLELEKSGDAKWVVGFLDKWERVWHETLEPEMDMKAYLQDEENMERLIFEARKHYCGNRTMKE